MHWFWYLYYGNRWFTESFNAHDFAQATDLKVEFVQDNHSFSRQWTLRGLHYQLEQTQGKLVDVVGTGGDGAHTFNISTAAMFVAAAAGAKIAKNTRLKKAIERWEKGKDKPFHPDHTSYEKRKKIETPNLKYSTASVQDPITEEWSDIPVLQIDLRDDVKGNLQAVSEINPNTDRAEIPERHASVEECARSDAH